MLRLASMLYSLIASSLASACVVIALVSGAGTLGSLLLAAGAGFLLALPVSWAVARQITAPRGPARVRSGH